MTPGGDAAVVQYEPESLSIDGRWVVYLADQDTDEVVELYSFSLRDGSRRKLNGALVAGGDVQGFRISPDSTRVVYRADQDLDEQLEIYSVPISGGVPVRLDGPMVAGGDVPYDADYVISSDSQRVVYRADEQTDEAFELFSVPIAGGTSVELSPASGVPAGFHLSADASRAVMKIGLTEIWSVPIAGGTPILLTPAHSSVDGVIVTPDSGRVVYRVRTLGGLYSVPIAGGTTLQLNDEPIGDGDAPTLRITPDSSRMVFVRSNHLYTVSTAGGPPTLLVTPIEDLVGAPHITPDSSRVVYIDGTVFGERWLYSVPITGGTPVVLNLPPNHVASPEISPDSGHVVFTHQGLSSELLATPIAGGAQVDVNQVPGTVFDYEFSRDPSKVVFLAGSAGDVWQLFAVSPSGGAARTLNRPLVAGGDVTGFVVRGPWVLYRADQDTNDVFELYVSRLTTTDFR